MRNVKICIELKGTSLVLHFSFSLCWPNIILWKWKIFSSVQIIFFHFVSRWYSLIFSYSFYHFQYFLQLCFPLLVFPRLNFDRPLYLQRPSNCRRLNIPATQKQNCTCRYWGCIKRENSFWYRYLQINLLLHRVSFATYFHHDTMTLYNIIRPI